MEGIINITARLIRASALAYTKKWSFFGLFGIFFAGTILVLASYDLLPNPPDVSAAPAVTLAASSLIAGNTSSSTVVHVEYPVSIAIPVIKLTASIANPDSTNIEVLDNLLLKGAVRYPTSAKLGEQGNVVLFAHSSYLPVVGNPAYKTFDGIQKLVAGDVVTVYSSSTAYTYRVRTVSKESANDAAIPLSVPGRVLTLSTCDSFTTKTDRFVVVADFIESHSVSR